MVLGLLIGSLSHYYDNYGHAEIRAIATTFDNLINTFLQEGQIFCQMAVDEDIVLCTNVAFL